MDSAVRVTPETDLGSWRRLLDELAIRYSPIHLSFNGGEPMLSSSLFPLLTHAKSLTTTAISTAMITNGLLLQGARLERVAPLLDVCAISLDGISPKTHDLVRGKGAFHRTCRNLQRLADTPFRKVLNIWTAGTAGPAPSVGVDGSALWTGVPVRPRNSCGYGDTLTIYSDGSVSTCLTPRFIRGNVFTDGAANLIDRIDRERDLLQVHKLPECRTCDLRHLCGGRCHLGQLRGGGPLGQIACSDRYKHSFYDNLVAWSSSG